MLAALRGRWDFLTAWGPRIGFSVLDQGLVSGANFILNVLLARWLSLAEYGAFGIVFAVFLFVGGFYSALVLEPVAALGVAFRGARFRGYLWSLVRIHVALTLVLAASLAAASLVLADGRFRSALLAMALASPLLLLFWLVRRLYYLETHARGAAFGSATYAGVMLAALALFQRANAQSAVTAIGAMAIASAVASALGLVRLFRIPGESPRAKSSEVSLRSVVREHWAYGKWVVAIAAVSLSTTQIQIYLAGFWLGLEGAGTYRALLNFVLPMLQTITAIGILGLPLLAAAYHRGDLIRLRQGTFVISSGLTATAALYVLALLWFGAPLERAVFGGKFAESLGLLPLLGLVPLFAGMAQGYTLELRAVQRPDLALRATALAAPIALSSCLVLIPWWGVGGAVGSLAVTFAALATLNFAACRRARQYASSASNVLDPPSSPHLRGLE